MKIRDEQNFPTTALNSQTSAGRLIAEARKANNLEQSDLAHRLRLDARIVKALERDDYDELAGATFVKGYIRSIAKELGIDPEPLLDAYRSHSGEEATPSLSDFESRPPPQISSNSAIVKAGSYALVAILVVLIFFWWRSTNTERSEVEVEATGSATEFASTQSPLPYEFAQVIHPHDPYFKAEAIPAEDSGEFAEQSPDTDGSAEQAADGIATIELSTDSEAWVEISDSLGNALHYGIVKSGRPLNVSSREPIQFIIGNSPSVRLQINGAPIDLDDLDVEGVAKFSYPLDPSG